MTSSESIIDFYLFKVNKINETCFLKIVPRFFESSSPLSEAGLGLGWKGFSVEFPSVIYVKASNFAH